MYNRYIPQPDGTYRRSRMEEHIHPPQRQTVAAQMPEPEPCIPQPPPPPCQQDTPPAAHCSEAPCQNLCSSRFMQQLLPRGFDIGDIMVIVLLLLIAGDCPEERSNALLTLALYFIM